MREEEWSSALELMRVNMQPYYERYAIAWDPEWIETNFKPRSNWVVTENELAVGFLSCEALGDLLHIHTLQLARKVQGRRVGLNVLRTMERKVLRPNMNRLGCSVFRDHSARHMYERMGFTEIGSKGNLVFLELPLIDGRYVLKRPNPAFQRTATVPLN